MPLPKPKKNEEKDKWLDRCMGEQIMNDDYPDNKQRYAVCNSLWEQKKDSFEDKEMEENKKKGRKIKIPDDYERRYVPAEELRIQEEDGIKKLVGYAAVFNRTSEDLGFFREKINPGAFANTLTKDVRALFNHDSNYVLGRTKAKTLKLKEDQMGLQVEITPPDTQWANDLKLSVERKDVDQMSFGFRVLEDDWDYADEKNPIRTLKTVELFDVSVVTFPAYPDTTVALRSMDNWQAELLKEEVRQKEIRDEIDRQLGHMKRSVELKQKIMFKQ